MGKAARAVMAGNVSWVLEVEGKFTEERQGCHCLVFGGFCVIERETGLVLFNGDDMG